MTAAFHQGDIMAKKKAAPNNKLSEAKFRSLVAACNVCDYIIQQDAGKAFSGFVQGEAVLVRNALLDLINTLDRLAAKK
jgi:hypothetical protein